MVCMIPLLDVTSLMTTTPEQLVRRRSSTPSRHYVRDMERIILCATASPMNLVRPNANDYTQGLLDRRRLFRDQVVSTWPKVIAPAIPRRRR